MGHMLIAATSSLIRRQWTVEVGGTTGSFVRRISVTAWKLKNVVGLKCSRNVKDGLAGNPLTRTSPAMATLTWLQDLGNRWCIKHRDREAVQLTEVASMRKKRSCTDARRA